MEVQDVAIQDIVFAEYNPRRLTKEQAKGLRDSLSRFGCVDPVIINQHPDRRGILVGGHQRCRIWGELGNKTIPAVFVNLTLDQEKELNVRLNKNVGEFDFEALANFFELDDLKEWGFTEDELKISMDEPDVTEGDDDVPEDVKTVTVRGDVYELGRHRLVCGDSISADDVVKLMGGELADMVFTDPPWNVNYGAQKNPSWKPRTILNDHMSTEDFLGFMRGVAGSMMMASKKGAPVYVVMSAQEWGTMMEALREGFHWSSTIIWKKDTLVLSRKDYHTQYEPIWYGWIGGESRLCPVVDRKQSDVWDCERPKRSELHPTTKPVELVERAIRNSSEPESMILELFCGSGTTLIAAEKSGRTCRAMELDPKYCDVIVNRYARFCRENGRPWSVSRNGKDVTGEYA